MALYGSPFLQSTLSLLSTTNRCHRFFLSRSFVNLCSPISGKPIACKIDSSITFNFNDPTLAQPSLNVCVNSSTTTMSNPSNFCKNGRNPNSCNSACSNTLWFAQSPAKTTTHFLWVPFRTALHSFRPHSRRNSSE